MLTATLEHPQDLEPLLTWLAREVGYRFDSTDWDAIRLGLFRRITDPSVTEETKISVEYEFPASPVPVSLTFDWSPFPDDPGWVRLKVSATADIQLKTGAAVEALNERARSQERLGYPSDALKEAAALAR